MLQYDTLSIMSIEEEDGVLKLFSIKDFPDPQKHNTFMATAVKAVAEGGSAL